MSTWIYCINTMNVQAHDAHLAEKKHALAVSLVMENRGEHASRVWRARVHAGHIYIDYSDDLAQSFSVPVNVNAKKMQVVAKGEARPHIAIGKNGDIYLTWTEALGRHQGDNIWFTRSKDGGQSYQQPYRLHQANKATRRYDAINVADTGLITVAWLEADALPMHKKISKTTGATIYYAVSNNDGASFEAPKVLSRGVCECCPLALANKGDGTPVAMWRHIFEGEERDHMMAEMPLTADKVVDLHRATFGHWQVDGCPHQGPALASGGAGDNWWGYHMAYFDGKAKKPGLYYSRMDGVAWASSPAKYFGEHEKQAAHPALLSQGERVWLVWQEYKRDQHEIKGKHSLDGGRAWSDETVLATTSGKVDYPQLLASQDHVYLAWYTNRLGLVIKQLD